MTEQVGSTKARVLRKDYERGVKLPKAAAVVEDLGFYFAVTKVVLPGKTNKTTLIEFRPSDVQGLIEAVRDEEFARRKKQWAKRSKKKDQNIAELMELLSEQSDKATSNDSSVAELDAALAKANKRADRMERNLTEARSKHEVLEKTHARVGADFKIARGDVQSQAGEITRLNAMLVQQQGALEALEQVNARLMYLIDHPSEQEEQEFARMRSASDLLDRPTIIRGNKPYPGHHGG